MRDRASGERIKVGTCEDLYYLRFDQLGEVTYDGDADPVRHLDAYRFRFPFPSEDGQRPGTFEDFERGAVVYGVRAPAGIDHSSVQFKADAGYVLSIPCPEQYGPEHGADVGWWAVEAQWCVSDCVPVNVRVGRNGFRGYTRIVQQAVRNGNLATILACGACGVRWNLPTLEDAAPVLESLHEQAARERETAERNGTLGNADIADGLEEIGRRVVLGYAMSPEEIGEYAYPLARLSAPARAALVDVLGEERALAENA